ncbi:hypothetical protein [Arthrobacter sp. Soil761]|uniref:hypothetical protein n=1 Tax=Arthrobacter sp. Soil761 TaxID=1736400 RepID=UPI0007014FBF|nr:hypothetical protein [Arthrobacter sp. Soil761]KRE76654.1 hypothetical protein ASG79_17655 [Arthrobacter sp. Soil761]
MIALTIPRPPMAVLPDTPDTRLLVDLTSYASDLSEASHALDCALHAGEGSELWMPLTSHAVTAYVRPFILSNVRKRLDEMPGIAPMPAALQPIHRVIREYRNTTIAHSQSNLSLPLPVAFLDSQGKGADVAGWSLSHTMPMALAEQFADLIAAVEDMLDLATQPVLERLRSWLKDQTPEKINGWPFPEILQAADTDFTASERRRRTPRFTTYWRSEQQHDEDPACQNPLP